MASDIKTYKKRPECAIPGCFNEAFIHMAGQWVCGKCVSEWNKEKKRNEDNANKELFNEMKEMLK